MAEIINNIHDISKECIQNSDAIGAVCPSHVSTRWIYDFDIVEFILKFEDVISNHCKIPIHIEEIYCCLKILKVLTKKFEDPTNMIGLAYQFIEEALEAFDELNNVGNIYAKMISCSLHDYTFGSSEVHGLLLTAYILTPIGHDEFYHRMLDQNYQKTTEGILQKLGITFPISTQAQKQDDDPMENLTNYAIDSVISDINFNDEMEEMEEEQNELAEVVDIDDRLLQVKFTVDYRKGILSPSFRFINNWVTRFVNDEVKRKVFYSSFNNFVTSCPDAINLEKIDNCYNWLHIRTIPNLEILGDLALRLQSTGCSEAACERIISAQRSILTSRRLKSTQELIDCRLKLMKGNPM